MKLSDQLRKIQARNERKEASDETEEYDILGDLGLLSMLFYRYFKHGGPWARFSRWDAYAF